MEQEVELQLKDMLQWARGHTKSTPLRFRSTKPLPVPCGMQQSLLKCLNRNPSSVQISQIVEVVAKLSQTQACSTLIGQLDIQPSTIQVLLTLCQGKAGLNLIQDRVMAHQSLSAVDLTLRICETHDVKPELFCRLESQIRQIISQLLRILKCGLESADIKYVRQLFRLVHKSIPILPLQTRLQIESLFVNCPSVYMYIIELAIELGQDSPLRLVEVIDISQLGDNFGRYMTLWELCVSRDPHYIQLLSVILQHQNSLIFIEAAIQQQSPQCQHNILVYALENLKHSWTAPLVKSLIFYLKDNELAKISLEERILQIVREPEFSAMGVRDALLGVFAVSSSILFSNNPSMYQAFVEVQGSTPRPYPTDHHCLRTQSQDHFRESLNSLQLGGKVLIHADITWTNQLYPTVKESILKLDPQRVSRLESTCLKGMYVQQSSYKCSQALVLLIEHHVDCLDLGRLTESMVSFCLNRRNDPLLGFGLTVLASIELAGCNRFLQSLPFNQFLRHHKSIVALQSDLFRKAYLILAVKVLLKQQFCEQNYGICHNIQAIMQNVSTDSKKGQPIQEEQLQCRFLTSMDEFQFLHDDRQFLGTRYPRMEFNQRGVQRVFVEHQKSQVRRINRVNRQYYRQITQGTTPPQCPPPTPQ